MLIVRAPPNQESKGMYHRLGSVTAKGERSATAVERSAIVRELADRIEETYRLASAETIESGRAWYVRARDLADGIASRHNLTRAQAISLIALTSPRCQWDVNLDRAESCARARDSVPGLFAYMHSRVRAILADPAGRPDLVRGEKVSRFRLNIAGDWNHATVDIWAVRCALGNLKLGDDDYKRYAGTPTRYAIIEDAYRRAAERVGLTVAETQAVTWLVVRDQADEESQAYWADRPVPF